TQSTGIGESGEQFMTSDTALASEPTLLINGAWRSAPARFDVHDPATGERIGSADDAGVDDAAAAVDAAAAAAAACRRAEPDERPRVPPHAAAAITADDDRLSLLLTRENGKPLAEARGELGSTTGAMTWAAEQARRADGRVIGLGGSRRGARSEERRVGKERSAR